MLKKTVLSLSVLFLIAGAVSGQDRPDRGPRPSEAARRLQQLSWMIGEWVDEDGDATVETKCEWAENHSFIKRTFAVTIEGQIEMRGTQVIAWDPAEQKIRSWVFDTLGGFGEAEWTRKGRTWTIQAQGTLPTGEKVSETRLITLVGRNQMTWEAVNRQAGGQILPDIPLITIVRSETE